MSHELLASGERSRYAIPVKSPIQVRCPTCRKPGDWLAGTFEPFCSERCKLADLGKWFGEENRISEPLKPEHFEEYADLPPGQCVDRPEPADSEDTRGEKN